MGKILSTLAIALALACGAPPARAISINFVPSVAHVAIGGTVNIDVVVSGLTAAGEVVSALDLNILFNNVIVGVTGADVSLNTAAFGGAGFVLSDVDPQPGDLGVILNSLISDADLDTLQGDSVTLFTVTWTGLADGFTLLQFGPDPDFDRNVVGRRAETLPMQYGTACISVGQGECRIVVPEPAALLLLAIGLTILAGVTRRRRANA